MAGNHRIHKDKHQEKGNTIYLIYAPYLIVCENSVCKEEIYEIQRSDSD